MVIDATRATQIIDRNFVHFDTAKQNDASKADDKISNDDLQTVADNLDGRFSQDEVETARFLLGSQAAHSFLDVGAGKGEVDGTIGRGDINGALTTISAGGLDQALLDTAAGAGPADGYISGDDIAAALGDQGVPQGLKDALAHLPPDLPLQTQLGTVFALRNNANDLDATATISTLVGSNAFRGLDDAQQKQALALFDGTTAVSQKARSDLTGGQPLSGSDHDASELTIDLNDPGTLQQYLSTYAKPVDKWRDAMPPSGVPDSRRQEYAVSGPETIEHEFPSGSTADARDNLPAWKYTVTIDGKSIDVVVPKENTTDPGKYSYPTIEQIAKGLAAQPGASIEATNQVVVNPSTPKEKNANGDTVDSGADMYAGGGVININPHAVDQPRAQKDFDFTFLHESAHLVEQPFRGGTPGFGFPLPGWNDAVRQDQLFSTHYAGDNYIPDPNKPGSQPSGDPGEDFAEAYMIYNLVKGTPDEAQMRALMPARFAILDQMYP